jgi:predicted DCC family thiol-disulfide oxidoreductase YuxK
VVQPVVLYDGECALCQRVVHVLLRLDGDGRLKFAPLQSGPAQEFLRAQGLPVADFDTLVLVPDWARRRETHAAFLVRTSAAIAALRNCGGGGRLVADGLAIFPAVLRDAGYRLVARVRHRIFGGRNPGPQFRPEWAGRFLA